MIKFFRHIRRSLIQENKMGKYFKYAIGEILLVVIGILIALQINNWNENRKSNDQRKELISNLITDFTDTNEDINLAIKRREDELNRMSAFYEIIKNETQTISVDSLRQMGVVFFGDENFRPNISSYKEAISNGDFKLLKSSELTQFLDVFFQAVDSHEKVFNFSGESFFIGAGWDLRKRIGSLNSIMTGSNSFNELPYKKMSYNEYKKMVNEPLAQAAFENSYILKRNLLRHLNTMKTSCDSILTSLHDLK